MNISRRRFLSGAAAVPISLRISSVTGVVGGAAIFPRPANAWVMAAIAVASVVAGMVADHNRGDGGLGAVLAATQKKLTLIIETLSDLQKQVAVVLDELSKLPGQFEAILRRDDIRRLQRECRAVLDEYLNNLKVRETFSSDQAWLDDKVKADLRSLLERLQTARGNLRADGAIDPTAALVVSSVAFLEHSLMNLLGYRAVDMRVRLQAAYLPWFSDLADARLSSSAQSYLENAAKRHAELMKAAAESPVGKRLGMKIGNSVLNACVGVNDFIPAVPGERICDPDPKFTRLTPNDPATVDVAVADLTLDGDPPEYAAKLKDRLATITSSGGRAVSTVTHVMSDSSTKSAPKASDSLVIAYRLCQFTPGKPEVGGELDRLFQNVALAEDELVVNGIKTGILSLKLVVADPLRNRAGQPSVPPDPSCSVEKLEMHDGNARLDRMNKSPGWAAGQREIAAFNVLLDEILTERSRASFALSSIAIANNSKAQLIELLKRYG